MVEIPCLYGSITTSFIHVVNAYTAAHIFGHFRWPCQRVDIDHQGLFYVLNHKAPPLQSHYHYMKIV